MTMRVTDHLDPGLRSGAAAVSGTTRELMMLPFPAERCGPPGMANGGWVSGSVAGHLAAAAGPGAVEVTLRAPTPLGIPLDLRVGDDLVVLRDGERVLVEARPSSVPVAAPPPVSPAVARAAGERFHGHHEHPFPGCFVCGIDRADGLRVFPGPVDPPATPASPGGDPVTVAATFSPSAALAGADGTLPAAAVWAALDCPTAWVNMRPGAVALLGRLRAQVHGRLHAGEHYQVVAQSAGVDGRKAYGRAAVYAPDGVLVGASEATWISVDGST
jgi:hypothetical protein